MSEFERVICSYIREWPHVLYDIGVGSYSEWKTLSQEYPSMQLFGCEPHRGQYADLLSQFPGLLLPVALDENVGWKSLYVPTANPMSSSLHATRYHDARQDCYAITLDMFDALAGHPDRILLWLDVEGSELAVLRSGRGVLQSGRIRWINLEERRNNDRPAPTWCSPEDVELFLKDSGYRRTHAYNCNPTHQDVIYLHKESFDEDYRELTLRS